MKFGIIVFPGSNCDRDVAYVTGDLLQQPTRMIWHQETDIADIDVIIIPGGFSYGDYLRCGAIARFSPVMNSILEHAKKGKYVLGLCNGFQILTEVGLLAGCFDSQSQSTLYLRSYLSQGRTHRSLVDEE